MGEDRKLIGAMFDEAMRLRDADDLIAARSLLMQLIQRVDPNDKALLGHSHMQLGLIAELCGEQSERVRHF